MLSWPYAHLLINHFPVVLSVVGLGASVLALLVRRRAIWQAAMGALVIAGLFIFPVHFTGDKADHALRDPWYIKPGTIEAHDNAAGIAMWVILLVGAFAAYLNNTTNFTNAAGGIPRNGGFPENLITVNPQFNTAAPGGTTTPGNATFITNIFCHR